MINFVFNENVVVKRRASVATAPRDSLNNPVYGAPTASWTVVYASMPVRLAFDRKQVEFAGTGERVKPNGVMYFSANYSLLQEDRIITSEGVEYVVVSLQKGYQTTFVLSHMEAIVELP